MILIKNKQRKIKLDIKKIKTNVEEILNIIGYSDFDIGIWFTTNNTIQKYNKQYRNQDKPTDILSFAYHSNIKPNKVIKIKSIEDKNLGDLIISPQYIQENLQIWNRSFDERLKVLIVHGICHLLGYDHKTDKDFKIMDKKEKEILNQLQN